LDFYTYQAYRFGIDNDIVALTKEGTGIRSTARLLKISPTTLLARIITIAKNIVQPYIPKGKTYQVDEMRTYLKRKDKHIWIVYALEKQTKNVVCFNIGRRTNKTLKKVITSLELSEAEKIITDKLKNYKFLIKPEIHSTKFRGINHIERKSFTLRPSQKIEQKDHLFQSKSGHSKCDFKNLFLGMIPFYIANDMETVL
jgi:IS1 family transposase